MGLLDTLAGSLGTSGIADAIAKHTGADPKTVQSAVAIGMPLLLAALARNASSPKGAADLHAAVQSNHAGGNILSCHISFCIGQHHQMIFCTTKCKSSFKMTCRPLIDYPGNFC